LTSATPILTYNPFTIPADGSKRALSVRVTVPTAGERLPVIVFSHGHAHSKDDYLPLTEYWARGGFAVIQPSHPDADDPLFAEAWRLRIDDMPRVAAALYLIAEGIPGLKGRLDGDAIIAAGHSFGGHTVAALIGATIRDPDSKAWLVLSDERFKGAVLLAPPGAGGADLSPDWKLRAPYLDMDWSTMHRSALVMTGALDASPMTVRDAAWHEDPYWRSPAGGKVLVVLKNAGHYLGGILGVRRTEVDDEDAERLRVVQAKTLDYMKMIVSRRSDSPAALKNGLAGKSDHIQMLECK